MKVVALVLAAGSSRRFGSDKRQARLATGETLLERAIAVVRQAGLPCLVAVPEGDTLALVGAERVPVRDPEQGMGHSIAEAVARLPADASACLVLPADLPGLSPGTITTVAKQARPGAITVPTHGGRRGHPVAFGREFFPELMRLQGDVGARSVIAAHADRVAEVSVDDPGIHTDIDTPQALIRFDAGTA